MSDDRKKLARALPPGESIAKRTLIRAFESHLAAKVQDDDSQDGDRQAPITLLRNPDGSPKRFVITTTDRNLANELHAATGKRIPIAVQLHRMPNDDELEALSRELPAWEPPGVKRLASRGGDMSEGRIRRLASREAGEGNDDRARPRRAARALPPHEDEADDDRATDTAPPIRGARSRTMR
jgi:hypothetical protein